jgi:hypothetical protein
MKTVEELQEQLDIAMTALETVANSAGNYTGCHDAHCIVKKPSGQHTNGGCHCGIFRPGDFQVEDFELAKAQANKAQMIRRLLTICRSTAREAVRTIKDLQ